MSNTSKNAANFVLGLANLATRLAENDIVVEYLEANWSSFGCWDLRASRDASINKESGSLWNRVFSGTQPEVLNSVFRIYWDGREGLLSIQTFRATSCSVVSDKEWRDVTSESFDLRQPEGEIELFKFVENYLVRKLCK